MSKIDKINKKIDDFRKAFTIKYQVAENSHTAYNQLLDKKFYDKASNKNKSAKVRPDFDMNTSTILAPYLIQWQTLTNEYKKLTGIEYKKPILYNANKEASLAANQAEKEAAREARDVKLEEQRKKKPPRPKARKNTGYAAAKAMYDKPAPKLEEIVLPSAVMPVKVTKGLFSDMKDIVNTIIENERKITGMQPNYGDRDRTGKLLTPEEIAQLKRIRATISKIPENVIIAPVEVKQEVKRRRGRPVVEGSKRQAKLAAPPEAKRRGRPPKKIEETKEETKQEETKEDLAPKKKRGRPVVEGSKRQAKLAVAEPKKPRGRPKKASVEAAPKARAGRPGKCDSIPPKSDEKRPMTQLAPVISRFEIEDNKIKLKSNQSVNPLLLKYNKLTPQLFFIVMEALPVRLSDEITTFYDKKTTRERLSYVFKLIVSYIVAKGLSTAHDIEVALVTRIAGELADDPKKLKAFMNFVRKNCIARKAPTQGPQKSMPRTKATKVFSLDKLTAFNDTQYDLTKDSFIDIIKNTFVGKQTNIRKAGTNYERVDVDEEGQKEYAELSSTLLARSIINNLLEAAEDLKPALFEKLDTEYKADKTNILRIVKEYLNNL